MKLSRERLAASVGKQTIVIFVFVMYLTGGEIGGKFVRPDPNDADRKWGRWGVSE